jgi:hypothetical protein
MPKPDFLIVGAQHGGTTWLWGVLDQHQDTDFPRIKERHFFGSAELYRKGVDWYLSGFDGLDPDKVICDASPTNFYDRVPFWHNDGHQLVHDDQLASIPELVLAALPDIKIIVSLRDPVSRAISAYLHWMRHQFFFSPGHVSPWLGLEQTARQYPKIRILEYGYYSKYLKAWQKVLPPERMLVLVFEEDVIKNPDKGIRKVTDFIGINPEFEAPLKPKAKNPSWRWSRIILKYYLGPMLRQIEKTPLKYITQNWDPLKSFGVNDRDLAFLQKVYANEKNEIEALTGIDLKSWRYL